MPRPESATSIATASPSACPPTRTTLSRGEYLIAFEIRFVRMRSSASGSASTGGSDGSHRSEEHTSELQSQSNLVCRLLLEKKKKNKDIHRQSRRHERTS